MNDLITQQEAAKLLLVQTGTLKTWRRQGKGPPYYRFGHRMVRYRRSEVTAYIQSHRRPQP